MVFGFLDKGRLHVASTCTSFVPHAKRRPFFCLPGRERHLIAIANIYTALGERTKSIQWTKKIQEYYKSKNDVSAAQSLEPFIENPESHPQWKLRIKAREGKCPFLPHDFVCIMLLLTSDFFDSFSVEAEEKGAPS
jgi:hypothetical protein